MHSLSTLLALGAAATVQAVDLESLRIKSTAEYVSSEDAGSASKFRHLKRETFVETATDLVKEIVPGATFKISEDHYTGTNGISHVYARQTIHDVEVDGAFFNVNIDKDGHVFSYGNSFYTGDLPEQSPVQKRDSIISPVEALDIVKATLELSIEVASDSEAEPVADETETYTVSGVSSAVSSPEAKLVYLIKPDGNLALSWKVETESDESKYSSYVDVDAETPEVVAVQDHVDWFTYEVYPFPINDPREGERIIVEDPGDSKASPFGWHGPINGRNYETSGNNIEAGAWPVAQVLFAESPNGTFVYEYEPDTKPPFDTYMAGVTQAFYITNMLHDLYYLLGFTPAAGNYQKDNNGEGGAGNDPVRVLLQSWGGMNNGKFTQSNDGGAGTLTMYLFDKTNPQRDSAFDSGFLMHEYTHGSGPLTAGCLTSWEPDGMAEGWSDIFAATLTIKPDEDRDSATYGFAAWPLNNTSPPTARLRMYSTNMEINEFTYSSANGLTAVHQVGTVWATMLYEVLWNLIDKYGKNDNPRPEFVDGIPTDGKFLTLKLLTDAFAIQPCNPSIVQARDAIIDADVALTGGENACEIWTGFAKRGLGAGAVTAEPRVDNFDLPEGVC